MTDSTRDDVPPPARKSAPAERFRPPAHVRPDSLANRIVYAARLVLDFQFNTIHGHLKPVLQSYSGKVIDVGAGQSPFMHLLDQAATEYVALDTHDAGAFGYDNADALRFDGEQLPLADGSVDHFLCTEVLEHVSEPRRLVAELYRVTRPGGRGIVTVPWSARCHYMPHDYYRYTPTTLRSLFTEFAAVEVVHRGTDLTVIASKVVVAYARLVVPRRAVALLVCVPAAVLLLPVVLAAVAVGHLAGWLRLGSPDDPLGYTIHVTR